MAAEPLVDLEGAPGAPRLVPAPATSAITGERSAQPADWVFITCALALGVLAGAAAWGFGMLGAQQAAERSARALAFGFADDSLAFGRSLSAVSTGVLVAAIAFAGRNLARSSVAGLLAASLVALDPSVLVAGRLALPLAPVLAGLALALVGFTSHRPWMPWVGGVALAAASLIDPRAASWGPVLAVVALLRGNIYASPRHLGLAASKAVLMPLGGVLLHVAIQGGWAAIPVCFAAPAWRQLVLQAVAQPGPSLLAQPGPLTWLVGLGALLFLGLGGMLFGASRFRLARANGRVQIRLVSPFPAAFGRGIWLLLLAAATLVPQAWLLLFALALALGVQDLGEDAPGFGLTLGIALVLFAVLVLWRSWGAVTGLDGAEGVTHALSLVPWAEPVAC